MILSNVRTYRIERGWSQDELARRAGLSRPAVSAIETGRVVPSVSAALSLAAVLACRVEDLFGAAGSPANATPGWAWPPATEPCPFWAASVGGRLIRYPVERTLAGVLRPDGTMQGSVVRLQEPFDPQRTLVIAGCDLAAGMLAEEMAHAASMRLLPFIRSSGRALALLRRGLVHVAGLHLQDAGGVEDNERAVREQLGGGYTLLRVTRWQEGLALQPGLGVTTIREVVGANLRWVGREEGSGARRCLDAILGRRRPRPEGYERIAFDHGGVAETIRTGWAQAGVCVRLAAQSAGLDFLAVRGEDYDLCYRTDMEDDPRVRAVLGIVRSRRFRAAVGALPGYDGATAGELRRVGHG